MESQEASGQKSQPQETRMENDEEIKVSSESIDKQIEDLLKENGYESIAQVQEELVYTKERIVQCANRPKQLKSAKDDLELLENILKKHAQLVQPKIQKLLDDLGLENIDQAIAEKLSLSTKMNKLPLASARARKSCQDDIDKIDEILTISNVSIPQPEQKPRIEPVIQPVAAIPKIQSDQVQEEAKIQQPSIINPVQQINQVQPDSLFQREKEDAQNLAGFIKSAPESFEKSVKLLTHILYQKLDNTNTGFDEVLGVHTSKYNDLIHNHLTNIKETFVGEVIKNNEIITKVNQLQNPNGENAQQLENILICLKQIQLLTCRFNFQEFFSYIEKADEASKSLGSCQSKCIVLLLGTTGAGKSTTIHYICGSEMYETQNNGLRHIAFGKVLNPDLNKVKVSPFSRSETRYIRPIDIDMKQLGNRTQEIITLVDTPGLFDLHNAEVDVSNQLGIVKALSQVESIRPFIVFSYKRLGARGEGFKEILNFYAQMIVDSRKITYFNFFFSHVDQNVKIENLKAKIVDILEQLNPKEKLNDRLVKFLEVIIERAEENKIFIIDPLNKKQILKILKDINETDEIPRPSQVFQKVISDESSQKIIEQFDLHAKAIRSAFKKAEAVRVDFMLTELKKFCDIMDSNQDYKQKLIDILKKLNQILSEKYEEVVSIFQQQLQSGNKISEQQVNTYQSNVQFSFAVDSIRQKYLCEIDGDLDKIRSYQDIEQEVERLIHQTYQDINKPQLAKLDQQNLQDFVQKLDILANSQIQNFVSIRNQYIQKIQEQINSKAIQATDFLRKIITLESNHPIDNQNQIVNVMSQKDNEEVKQNFEQEKLVVLPVDLFADLMKELEKADLITKNQTLKLEIKTKIDQIVSFLKKKFEEMNTQYFIEIQRIDLQNMNNIQSLSDEDLNSQANIQMNKSKVEWIQKYYQFLENFIYSMKSQNLSQGFIDIIEGRLTQLNDKMIFWYSVQEEKLKRKISQDRKYSAIKSIYDEIILVKDLPALKGQAMRQNRIKMNLTKLVKDKSDEAKKYIGQIEKLVNQQQFEESKTKENQQINFYTLVSLKEAISTIKDLKWTIEGNEDIYEELNDELKGNLRMLVILIEENVKKTREESTNFTNSGGTEQAFKQISEIQSIAKIINIELPDINVEDYIPEIEQNLNGCEKFLASKEISNINEESKSDVQSQVNLLKKQECDKFFTYYTYFKQVRKNDFMIKRIDEITAKNAKQKINLSERVKILHEKLEEFVRQHMELVNKEFERQLNLIKQYLNKIQTLSRNDEGFYDNQDHQNKASQYLDDYLVNPVEIILGIFKMIKELKQIKYQQLWNKLSQNEDYEENFKLDILKFYRTVDEGIARARSDQVQITNSLKVINQLIPLDLYVNEQNEQEKGQTLLFQSKYDEYFKSLCNFHDQVVNIVEEYIKYQKYDEIKDNLITLQQLDGKDQQTNMRKVQQKLMQKCNDLSTQITKDIKFLLRDKQLDADRTGELNKKSTELYDILEKIGERFLTKPVFDKGKLVLEYFQKQISSNFEKIKECINNQIQNNNFSEAYDSLINYQNSARNIDVNPSHSFQTGDQIQGQKDYYEETNQLHKFLIDSIDKKVEDIKKAIKDSLQLNDDSILIQIKEKCPRDIIENLQKSSNKELLNYASKIIEAIKTMFQDKITTLTSRVGKNDQKGQEIFQQINDYLKFCPNFPQELNDSFKDRIEEIKKNYLKNQENESNEVIDLIQNKQQDQSYIELVYNRISSASYNLDKKSQSRLNDFYKQSCKHALNAIQSNLPLKIQENIYQLWKFQSSSESIQNYLDPSANNSFQELIKVIQEIYKLITDQMNALFQRREIQNSINIQQFQWFYNLFTHKNYKSFANEIIPNAGETLFKVIEIGIKEIAKCQTEFSRLIKSDDPETLSEIFPIIQFMRNIQSAQDILLNLDAKILLESQLTNFQNSAEKYKEFQKLSEEANKEKYCEKLAQQYKQLQTKLTKDSSFFALTYSQLEFDARKIQHQKLAKYLNFLNESQSISQDLKIVNIQKLQKEWEDKINNFYAEKIQLLDNLLLNLDNLNLIKSEEMEQINNLFEDILISSGNFNIKTNFQVLKQKYTSIVKQLRGKYVKDPKQPQPITDLLIKLQEISQNIKQLKECAQQAIQETLGWLQNNSKDQTLISQIALLLKKSPAGSIIVEQQQIFICEARTFWAKRIESQDIEFVLDNLKKNNGSLLSTNEKQNLKTQYDLYLKQYTKLVENYIVPYENIPNNMKDIKIKLLDLTQKYKQQKIDNRALDKIYEVLACLFALWTLSDFHQNKLKCDTSKPLSVPYLLKPHPAQVISILRILGQGYDQIAQQEQVKLNPTKKALLSKYIDKDILFDNLVQIKTGEGKSITLAIVISVFALWDFEVSCACYSQYLSQRDFQQFKHIFQFLNINEKIFYGTFNQICENYINKDGDIRNITLNRILKDSNIQIKPKAQADKRVILIDEVDVFFSKEFFNKMYVPVAQIKHPKVSNLLDFIWSNRESKLFTFKKLQLSGQYNECKALFKPEYAGILDEACKEMFSAAQNFKNHDYVVQDSKIGYHDMEQVSFSKSYGYNTIFAHYYHEQIAKEGQKVSKQNLDASKALEIYCGQFSYAEIPLYSMLILGVTGTLDSLSNSEKSIINDVFQIRNFTYSPSVYGQNKLKWNNVPRDERTMIFSKQDYLIELTNEIKKKIVFNNSQRAVIVFFKNLDLLKKYKNSQQYAQLSCSKQELTELLDNTDKENKIIKATYKNTLTLTTRSFGRGTDFICRDEAVETNGGVHVILTFVPEMNSEFIQIQGRTARQGNSGSFQLILLDSDLSQFDINVESTDYNEELKDKLDFIIKKRDKIMMMSQQSDTKAINDIKTRHQEAIEIKNILAQNNASNSAIVSKYLIKINEGPSIQENQNPVKTLILMDATGSMSSFLQQAKNSVNLMYERSGKILIDNGLEPQLNLIQYACYRNYSSENLILQNSPWQSKPDQLKSFMDSISVSGGMGNEAVEIGFQHAVREAQNCGSIPLRQVFLIGDMPPNTKQEVDSRRNSYQFWKNNQKFTEPAYWDIELSKLKQLKVQVNTFYVDSGAKQSFEDIAKRTGGTCRYLDLSQPNSQELLLELFLQNVFLMIGQAAGDTKIGEKLVADYMKCYK